VAPEVLNGSYTYKCDIWSIGVIAYILLCGFAPFSGESDTETMQLVQHAELEFPSPEWDHVSEEAKAFITLLLQRDAFARPTAAEALENPWVAKHFVVQVQPELPSPRRFQKSSSYIYKKEKTTSMDLNMDSERRSAFQKFFAGLKMKKTLTTMSHKLTPSEAQHLGDVFRRVDQDKDGKIDVADIDQAVKAGSFSSSLKQNLMEMRSTLARHPHISFDIRPFIDFTDQKSKSESGQV
jgi:calcium-dependent protein kinase